MAATGENNAKPSVDFVFKDWLELLQKFYNDVEQTLETVRQDKREIQEIKKKSIIVSIKGSICTIKTASSFLLLRLLSEM